MYQVKNTSASDINLEGSNLAPGRSVNIPTVSLALRSLEEIKALKITYIEDEKASSAQPVPEPVVESKPEPKPKPKSKHKYKSVETAAEEVENTDASSTGGN